MRVQRFTSIYIVEPESQGWIIERLMRDLACELERLGCNVNIGRGTEYSGQEIILNSRYLTPFFDERAKINSVFITHVDDRIREAELKRTFISFNSFVCMSPHDADFVTALKGGSDGVVGLELPLRDQSVRPIRLAIFSACYKDKRKNEDWILEYFSSRPKEYRDYFIFCFLGSDWERFSCKLAAANLNFEISRYSNSLQGEYFLYKEKLISMDALLYLGFDGGAMSVYDAINAGIDIIATDISYHRDLGTLARLFDDRTGFFDEMDRLFKKSADSRQVVQTRSVANYARRLMLHWESIVQLNGNDLRVENFPENSSEIISEFRGRYKKLDYSRVRSGIIRYIQYIKHR